MRKKIAVLTFLAVLAIPSVSYASTNNNLSTDNSYQNSNPQKVAIVEDIMKDVVKRTIYKYGTQMLDKFVNPDNYNNYSNNYNQNYNYNNNTSNQNTSTNNQNYSSNNNSNTSTPTQQDPDTKGYVPGQEPEPMIPVS